MSEQLQQELEQAKAALRGLNAQLVAHKQVINGMLEESVNLRTNLNLYQQAHEEVSKLYNQSDSQLKVVQAELNDLKNATPADNGCQQPEANEEAAA